jgi:hypothetical protein
MKMVRGSRRPLTPNPAYYLNEKGVDAVFFKAVIAKGSYGIL